MKSTFNLNVGSGEGEPSHFVVESNIACEAKFYLQLCTNNLVERSILSKINNGQTFYEIVQILRIYCHVAVYLSPAPNVTALLCSC
jgi:hypothetical protein